MKKTIQSVFTGMAMALLLVAGIVVASSIASGSAKAQSQERRQKMAVLISATETYHHVVYVDQWGYTNSYSQADGMVVSYTSSSTGTPAIAPGTPLGEAIAQLLSLGLKLQPQPVYGLYLMAN